MDTVHMLSPSLTQQLLNGAPRIKLDNEMPASVEGYVVSLGYARSSNERNVFTFGGVKGLPPTPESSESILEKQRRHIAERQFAEINAALERGRNPIEVVGALPESHAHLATHGYLAEFMSVHAHRFIFRAVKKSDMPELQARQWDRVSASQRIDVRLAMIRGDARISIVNAMEETQALLKTYGYYASGFERDCYYFQCDNVQ
jgi:hypothetical protein